MYKDFDNLSVIDFAQQIRTGPSAYFRKDIKLSQLENILWGFNLNSQKESIIPFQYFNYWTKRKLNKFGSKYNWMVAILESCNNDEEKAFWKFYELLDEFVVTKPKNLIISELSADNFAFYYSGDNKNKQYRIIGNDNRYILDPAPYHIKLFEFDYCVHSYHFDYYWLIDEYDKNIYYNHFEDLTKCKAFYADRFNITQWTTLDPGDVELNFIKTIDNCRNRRQNII